MSEPLLRIPVVQPEPPPAFAGAGLRVGVLPWKLGPRSQLTVIVKATLGYDSAAGEQPGVPRLLGIDEAEPLRGDVPLAVGSDSDLFYASDFVPRKAAADVLLVGHAFSAEASNAIACSLSVAEARRSFVAVGPEPARAVALIGANFQGEGGAAGLRCGPHRSQVERAPCHHPDFDFAAYNAAPEIQRCQRIAPDATIELEGLDRSAARRVLRLPELAPIVYLEMPLGEHEVPLACDTLWIDTDRQRIVQVWRGTLPTTDDGREIFRIIARLERAGAARMEAAWRPLLQRGGVSYAQCVGDPADAEPAELDARASAARYASWLEPAPDPLIPLKRYVAIAAQLAEATDRPSRAALLDANGYDEDGWLVEERAWLEKIARAALDGDATLANDYSAAYLEAQDELASAQEAERSLEQYAAIVAELERSQTPAEVLGTHRLSLPAWVRLDRRYKTAAAADAAVAAELDAALAAHRAAAAQAAEPAADEGDG